MKAARSDLTGGSACVRTSLGLFGFPFVSFENDSQQILAFA